MEKIKPHEIDEFQKGISNKKYCSHPVKSECKGRIVKAHTVPKSRALDQISENNHVYCFNSKGLSYFTLYKHQGRLVPTKFGVRNASPFTGFCEYHDTELFRDIDDYNDINNEVQAGLLFYRELCHEHYKKRIQLQTIPLLERMGYDKPFEERGFYFFQIGSYEIGINNGLKDIRRLREIINPIVIQNDFSRINYYIIKINELPEIICSGITQPDYDFHGNFLQSFAEIGKTNNSIQLSIFPINNHGVIVFSWIDDINDSCKRLMESLNNLGPSEKIDAVIRFVLTYFENVYWNIPWWDSLDKSIQKEFINRFNQYGPSLSKPSSYKDALVLDDVKYIDWETRAIISNIDF